MRDNGQILMVSAPVAGPVDPDAEDRVPPALRVMLEPEAVAEANAFHDHLTKRIAWGNCDGHPGGRLAFVERQLVGKLAERWPYIARADRAVGGLLSEALRAAAAHREFPPIWDRPALMLAARRPELMRELCEEVIAYRRPDRPMVHAEEAGDRFAGSVAEDAHDRDAPQFEGADDCPF